MVRDGWLMVNNKRVKLDEVVREIDTDVLKDEYKPTAGLKERPAG